MLTPELKNQYVSFIKQNKQTEALQLLQELTNDEDLADILILNIEAGLSGINDQLEEGLTALQLIIRSGKPDIANKYVPILLKMGADPNAVDINEHDALWHFIDKIPHLLAKDSALPALLTKYAADPNTKYKNQATLLHNLLLSYPQYVPSVIINGADPTIITKSKLNSLDLLMKQIPFYRYYEKWVVLMMLEGAVSNLKNSNNENILQILYKQSPSMKDYLLEKDIPISKLDDVDYVFNHINKQDFNLELKCHTIRHQARNQYLNTLIRLANDYQNAQSTSLFKTLPLEDLFHLLSYAFDSRMDKSDEERLALIHAVFEQTDEIKEKLKAPGGINVFQKNEEEKIAFTFFKSSEVLCRDYDNKEASFKKMAKEYFKNQNSMFSKPSCKTRLQKQLQDHILYKDSEKTPSLKM